MSSTMTRVINHDSGSLAENKWRSPGTVVVGEQSKVMKGLGLGGQCTHST